MGYRKHGRGQGVGHLVFHHLRGLPGVLGEDDHLDVRQVGNGVQRGSQNGISAPGDDEKGRQDYQELVLD